MPGPLGDAAGAVPQRSPAGRGRRNRRLFSGQGENPDRR
ncbi:hypothetical protein [Azospirillum argentinense]